MSNEQVISNVTATKRRTVYLAGALAPNGWRHLLVQGFSDKPIFANEFPVMEGAIFGRFDYVGPFHVRIQTDEHKFEDNSEHTERTWNLRRIAIDKADEVFGWIEPNEAFATIAELAYAAERGSWFGVLFQRKWGILIRMAVTDYSLKYYELSRCSVADFKLFVYHH